MDCSFGDCLPVCISGIIALAWTAYQEWKLRKIDSQITKNIEIRE